MPPGSEVKFEIGHVLFFDIVGYSKLLITEHLGYESMPRLVLAVGEKEQ